MTLSDHDWRKLRAQAEASLTRQQRWQIARAHAERLLGFDPPAKQTRDRHCLGNAATNEDEFAVRRLPGEREAQGV
jgi:regulator of sirC expression with transglutaminase-like and TPR domain